MTNRYRTLAASLLTAALAAACAVPTLAQAPAEAALLPPRIGALSLVEGRVDLADASGTVAAASNWPVGGGVRLSTQGTGRAEVAIGSLALRADGDTSIFFERVDDSAIRLLIERGSVGVSVRNPAQVAEIEIGTPRERIVFEQPGRYRIDVDRLPGATTVTVFAGTARVAGPSLAVVVAAGQRGEFRGAPATSFLLLGAAPDAFDAWALARDAAAEAYAATAPYLAAETTGAVVLANTGAWQVVPQYGALWFPAAVEWVPYRSGRWVYAGPWGRTWIDTAPWGFVTTRYGNWVNVGGRWGWRPHRHLYAPVHRHPPSPPPRAWAEPRQHSIAPPPHVPPPITAPRPVIDPMPPPPAWRPRPPRPPQWQAEHAPAPRPPAPAEHRQLPPPAQPTRVAAPPSPPPAQLPPPAPAARGVDTQRLHVAPPPSVRLPKRLRDEVEDPTPGHTDPRGRVKAAIP